MKTFAGTSNGPLISDSIAVSANTLYNVQVEVMSTDLGDSGEYLDITIDGQSFGRCDPRATEWECKCGTKWYNCTLSKSQLTTSSSNIPIRIQYSSNVGSWCSCSYNGLTGSGIARITFTTI